MGYLVHLVLALLALALVEEGLALPDELPLVVLALAALPYVLAALTRRASLQGRFRRAGVLLTLLHFSPALLHALAVLACGWTATLERLAGVEPRLFGWPRPASLLALAPFAGYTLLAIDARARALHRQVEGVVRTWRFQGRMFASSLAPLVVYVLIAWGVGSSPALRARVDHVQLYGALFAGALLLLFLTLLPFLLARTWDTAPLEPGPLRELLQAVARRARFRCRRILVWRTEHQMANAAVVGIAARVRVVLLSDALLTQLHPRETVAVFAHEIGHARRHHVLVFVAWSAAFFMGVDLAAARWLPESTPATVGVLLASLVAWYLGFGWLSRRFELDADLYSAELLGDVEPMVGALEAVGGPHGHGRRTWRHFSTGDRVAFLRRLALEPEHGARLRRRLRALAWTGAVLSALALLGEGAGIARALPGDHVRVELALGRYDAAARRLATVAEPDPGLARKVALALALSGAEGTVATEELVSGARDELARGDLVGALDRLELAALREDPTAGGLLAALVVLEGEGVEPGAWEAAAERLDPEHPGWGEAVRRGSRARRSASPSADPAAGPPR